ncbi:MAG: hypothetical protein R6U19_02305 [Bacteroidales bacterium]
MKRTIGLLVSLAFIFSACSIFQGGGSKDFQGKITYKITYPGVDMEPAQKAQLPSKATVYVMDNYSKMEMHQGMAKITQLIDGSARTKTIMISAQGMNKYYTQTEEQIEAQNADIDIVSTEKKDETKEIAGYTAKKIVVEYKNEYDETETLTMYYTPEIGNKAINFDNPYMKNIDGMVLEYEIVQGETSMLYTAEEIEPKKLKESDFLVPSDYEKLTEEEMQQMGM